MGDNGWAPSTRGNAVNVPKRVYKSIILVAVTYYGQKCIICFCIVSFFSNPYLAFPLRVVIWKKFCCHSGLSVCVIFGSIWSVILRLSSCLVRYNSVNNLMLNSELHSYFLFQIIETFIFLRKISCNVHPHLILGKANWRKFSAHKVFTFHPVGG